MAPPSLLATLASAAAMAAVAAAAVAAAAYNAASADQVSAVAAALRALPAAACPANASAPVPRHAAVEAIQCPCGTAYAPMYMGIFADGFLWCQTPKAGSTSFEALAKSVLPEGSEVRPSRLVGLKRRREKQNLPFELSREVPAAHLGGRHPPCGSQEACRRAVCEFPSFVVIRNPWDRLLSTYRNKLWPGSRKSKKERKLRFRKFFAHWKVAPTFAQFLRSWVLTRAEKDEHTARSSSACNPHGGRAFGYSALIAFEYGDVVEQELAFFEAYGLARWAEAARAMIAGGAQLSNADKTTRLGGGAEAHTMQLRRHWYLNESVAGTMQHPRELVDIIAKVYADDIAAYGYTFERFGPDVGRQGPYGYRLAPEVKH